MDETQREQGIHVIPASKIDEHVHDSSLDYRGKLPLRASTGSWKSSLFILVIEFSERLSYFGIVTNLITYMTKVMHQDLAAAANSVNIWTGVTTVMPILGGFLADAYTGSFTMILFSSILYVLGLSLSTMAQFIPSLRPCGATLQTCEHATKVHEVVFYTALYLVSIATGGFKPCLQSFGADQFDDNDTKERKQKMSFFNWWIFSLACGILLADTLIVYMQDNVGWGFGFLILALTMGFTFFVFIIGRPFYRYRAAKGSPLTPLLQVLVASFSKRSLPYPSDSSLLYEVPKSEKRQGQHLGHTNKLRILDKAAIIEEHDGQHFAKKQSPWRLATVTQVEELKLLINMIPIWLTSSIFGLGVAQGTTFFIKQGSPMNRRIYKHFEVPPASMYILTAIAMMVTIAIYDRVLIPYLRRATGNERGINILKRIGIGMTFLIIGIIVAAIVERKRLMSSRNGNKLSVFWLAPQFLITGIGDGLSLVGMQEFFYGQVPNSMRTLGLAFCLSIIGVGSFLSTFFITIVNSVTGMNGGKKWIGKDLTDSRLDYFYWFLTCIFVINLCVFVFLAKHYTYKNVQRNVDVDHFPAAAEEAGVTRVHGEI